MKLFATGLCVALTTVQLASGAMTVKQATYPATAFPQTEASGARVVLKAKSVFEVGSGDTEYIQWDSTSKRVFSVNTDAKLFVYSLLSNGTLTQFAAIDLPGNPNSVYYGKEGGILAVAVGASPKTDNGQVLFFKENAQNDGYDQVNSVTVGPLPDHVSFGPGGKCAYVANEGEFTIAFKNGVDDTAGYDEVDPVGGVSQICASNWSDPSTYQVTTKLLDAVPADATTISDNMHHGFQGTGIEEAEPEFITYGPADPASGDYRIYVVLQDNNAMLVYKGNTNNAGVFEGPFEVHNLGLKPYGIVGNELDTQDDGEINIQAVPGLYGLFQPDTIVSAQNGNTEYYITANEGDAKEACADPDEDFCKGEEVELADLAASLDTTVFNLTELEALIPEFKLTPTEGLNAQGKYEKLVGFGGRSFSVFDGKTGELVYDSGAQLEKMVAKYVPGLHNAKGNNFSKTDSRSKSKGPEPESLAIGPLNVGGNTVRLLFVGLERPGLVAVYDATNPAAPVFHSINGLVSCDPNVNALGDPESMVFVPAGDSPTGAAQLIVTGATSQTITVFDIETQDRPPYYCTPEPETEEPAPEDNEDNAASSIAAPAMLFLLGWAVAN